MEGTMAGVDARVAVLEGWKDTHKGEHEALWATAKAAYDRSLTTEARLAAYSAIGGIVGSVVGSLVVWFLTRGHP
jgi:hypothetical protein